ncbi:MAG: DUF4139 domain-containing protein [Bacteroidales bacterium]|nr:DUF4139 domain-containing protein [Bacteroidales bacterium]
MKKHCLLLTAILLLAAAGNSRAAEPQSVRAKLTHASVYLQGATLTHTATVTLKSGAQEIQIQGLSPDIEKNSLKVKASGNNILSSVEFSTDYITGKTESARLQQLRDSLKLYQKKWQEVNNNLSVNNKLLKILTDGITNNTQQKDKTISSTELAENLELYKAKAPALMKQQNEFKEQQENINQHISRLQKQIKQDESKERQRSGVVTLSVSAPVAGKAEFTITYYTAKASWTPCYDIQVPAVGKPVSLIVKAQVMQTTGLDWEQVKLNLSNARPNNTNNAPLFTAWFLRYSQPASLNKRIGYSNTLVANKTQDFDVEMDEAAVEYAVKPQTAGNKDETIYLLNGQRISAEEYRSIDPAYIASMEVLKPETAQKRYGWQATTYVISSKTMDDFVELQENEAEASYVIALPYSIPGNGMSQLIELKQHTVKADYYYYAAPKLAAETFLMVTLSDWEQYRLLPGDANVIFNDTYTGRTRLHTGTTDPTLTLTLATEPRISVKREKRKEFTSTKTLGSSTTATRSHLITVKNNTQQAVPFCLKEQYPISTNKEIEVKLTENSPEASTNNSDLGVLTWTLQLKPGETRTFTVTYTVKYPKDHNLNLE